MSPRSQQMMGGFGVPPLTKGVKALGIVTLVVSIASAFQATGPLIELLVFVPASLKHFWLWTPLTYTFVNPQPFNLIFSLLGLWLLGSALEMHWGTRRFVIFYFASAALAALGVFVVALFAPSVMRYPYTGNVAALAAMVAAFSVQLPHATIFLYVVPIQARWLLPISAGIALLFMIMVGWQPYLTDLFGLGAGVLLAGGVSPGHFWLRAKVWWIDKRLKRSKLRVVKGGDPFGQSSRGSDKYLH
jgi:membrane associated rhomboid family serine protease